MKKYNFFIGLTLLIVSIILSNIFNENTITNRAIESFFYLPIAYSFVKAFCSKGNWLNLLLVSALICSIFIFTPKWGAWACLVINIVCCLFSYIILLLAIKIAKYFDLCGWNLSKKVGRVWIIKQSVSLFSLSLLILLYSWQTIFNYKT